MKISYLGPKGNYTEKAAKKYFNKEEYIPENSLAAVVNKVHKGESDRGVIAYYNYLEGLVQECLDEIYEKNLKIVGAIRLPIVLSIGGFKGDKIYSHPKALAQCSNYLYRNYYNSKQISVESTVAGIKLVKESKSGLAIGSEEAINNYGIDLIDKDIGNKRHGSNNYTNFYIIAKESKNGGGDSTLVAITPNTDKPGLLLKILSPFAREKINIITIHSRPAIDKIITNNGAPQMFYLEVKCNKNHENYKGCIKELEKEFMIIKTLGSYSLNKI